MRSIARAGFMRSIARAGFMRSIARAPLGVDEFVLRSTTASPAANEAQTHQRGNALLAEAKVMRPGA
jgi:hypothetical protein